MKMKWKRYILMGAGLLVICGFLVSCCCVPRPHHRVRGKRVSSIVFLRMDNEATRLGLTDSQTAQYEALKERVEKDMERDIRDFKQVPDEVLELLETDDPDLEEIVNDLKYRIADREDPRDKYLDYLVEFYNILDERQKELFMEDLRKELDRHDRFRRIHRWG
jgi:transcriptional regulator with XRE-family HTH domain